MYAELTHLQPESVDSQADAWSERGGTGEGCVRGPEFA
jgi:hypothetical protein